MATREPGRFRRNLFGGFNRKDVLSYIKTIYEELDQNQGDNETLRQRCVELENLIQNLQRGTAWDGQPTPAETPDTEPAFNPLDDPELLAALAAEPAPAEELTEDKPAAAEEPPTEEAQAQPEPAPEADVEEISAETIEEIPEPEADPEPAPDPNPAPAPTPTPPPQAKPTLAMPPAAVKPTRVKVRPK